MSATHTLASREGFARFVLILNAQEAWRGMTKPQREALTSRLHGEVSPRTLAALERRELVANGLMTAWGDIVREVNITDDASIAVATDRSIHTVRKEQGL